MGPGYIAGRAADPDSTPWLRFAEPGMGPKTMSRAQGLTVGAYAAATALTDAVSLEDADRTGHLLAYRQGGGPDGHHSTA